MASVLGTIKPRHSLSEKTSPPALQQALKLIFQNALQPLWLVGGTAIAGYYAEHRRSDDLDLFAGTEEAHRAAILAMHQLKKAGASLLNERRTPNYYHADVAFLDHAFTIDIVLDENLHRIGRAFEVQGSIWVADLKTLFSCKVATLVSRCSEKDLFDLAWMAEQIGALTIANWIEAGEKIDGGLNAETLLFTLQSANLRKEACHFLLPHSNLNAEAAYKKIIQLKKQLVDALLEYERSLPPSADSKRLAQGVKEMKKLL